MSAKLTIIEAHVSIILDDDGLVETSVRTNRYGPRRAAAPEILDIAAETLRSKLDEFEPQPPTEAQCGVA